MFDESFKRMVIEEYLSTKCNKMELLRKYNIHFKSAIQTWMRKLEYEDTHRCQKFFFPAESPPRDSAIHCSLSNPYPLTGHGEARHRRLAVQKDKTVRSCANITQDWPPNSTLHGKDYHAYNPAFGQ